MASSDTSDMPTVGMGMSGAGAVLGISVVDAAVTSVVRGGAGEIIASNIVDLAEPSPIAAQVAITELIESVPFAVDQIFIACARPSTGTFLADAFGVKPGAPAWASKVSVADLPIALAEVARAEQTRGGIVAVVDLDREGVPVAGRSIITVDTTNGTIIGASEFNHGSPAPITSPDGANAVSDAVVTMPGGAAVTQVLCCGPGAELPGLSPALEYAVSRPVNVVSMPTLATATGAAIAALRTAPVAPPAPAPAPVPARTTNNSTQWWLVGAGIVASLLLGGIVGALLAGGGNDEPEVVATTSTVTQTEEAETITETQAPDTETVVRVETSTVTAPPSTTTETTTETLPPSTVTETETETVEITVEPESPTDGE